MIGVAFSVLFAIGAARRRDRAAPRAPRRNKPRHSRSKSRRRV
jgi:hypothetical protein